jgi:hypothetical protein
VSEEDAATRARKAASPRTVGEVADEGATGSVFLRLRLKARSPVRPSSTLDVSFADVIGNSDPGANGRLFAAVLGVSSLLGATPLAATAAPTPNGVLVGKVLVCNTPNRCLTRVFRVSAIDSADHVVAHATTSGPDNSYRLTLDSGLYSLVATSHGLRCTRSARVGARPVLTANITCLVP